MSFFFWRGEIGREMMAALFLLEVFTIIMKKTLDF